MALTTSEATRIMENIQNNPESVTMEEIDSFIDYQVERKLESIEVKMELERLDRESYARVEEALANAEKSRAEAKAIAIESLRRLESVTEAQEQGK